MRTPVVAASLLIVIAATELTGSPSPAATEVVQQFLEREEPKLRQYRAFRRLEAYNERFNASGWMEVCSELQPDGVFAFRIIDEGGSGYVRGRVLKRALEEEAEAWSSGETDRSGLTSRNYRFEPLDEDSEIVKVSLKPLRKDRMLVDGIIFLTREDADLVRLDGRLSKNPSFWTTRVEVVRTYARIAGLRLPVALESAANVRIAGRSTFRMSYEYLAVNDHVLHPEDGRCAVPASVALP